MIPSCQTVSKAYFRSNSSIPVLWVLAKPFFICLCILQLLRVCWVVMCPEAKLKVWYWLSLFDMLVDSGQDATLKHFTDRWQETNRSVRRQVARRLSRFPGSRIVIVFFQLFGQHYTSIENVCQCTMVLWLLCLSMRIRLKGLNMALKELIETTARKLFDQPLDVVVHDP